MPDSNLSNCKRIDYINWDDFFMGTALLAARRSKDPVTQVGAVVVNEHNVVVGVGYNGMPVGCSDDFFPWGKTSLDPLENKYAFVCHAEMNAILNKNIGSLQSATIYSTHFPCNECAKLIIQSKIKRVIFLVEVSEKLQTIAAKRMFDSAGIEYMKFESSQQQLVLDFTLTKKS